MRKWIHIAILLSLPSVAEAQLVSNKGRFTVDASLGCAPFTVTISSQDSFGDITRLYSFDNTEEFTDDTTFTYTAVGVYQIIQVIQQDVIEDKTDTLIVEVVEPQKPVIEINRCNGFQFSITSLDTYYDSIRVYFTTQDSVTLQTNQSTTFSYGGTTGQTIGLEGLFDNANETCSTYFEEVIPLQELLTPELMEVSVKEACRDNYSLYLKMHATQEQVNYRVFLSQNGDQLLYEGPLDSSFVFLKEIPFTVADYCISVEVVDLCLNTTLRSNELCQSPTELSLSPFESLYSTYQESSIYINLDEVIEGTFEVQRRFPTGAFVPRNEQVGSFADPIGSTSRAYLYQLSYRDVCGEILSTAETNPPLVSAMEIDDNRFEIALTAATNSLGTPNEVLYEIAGTTPETFDSNPLLLNLDPNNGIESQSFYVNESYADALLLKSNTLSLNYELVVHVPKAFTPNNDGLNDRLGFFGVPSQNAVVNIYSKWGQTIYTSNDLSEGWDGRVSGKTAASGTYLYEIVLELSNGQKLRQRGTFVLLQN